MRVLLIPLVAFGTMIGETREEPNARQMQAAFAFSLQRWVTNATEFAAASGGTEALSRIRQNETDWFAVRSFEKLDCVRAADGADFLCGFRVDVDVVNETLPHTLTGRFRQTEDGLVFEPHDQDV